ncbi:MAG: hypothetical protein HYS13_12210 [Planctomycetia bacterium]|nr:hypothetical protein [Planctomycetia bacterium]
MIYGYDDRTVNEHGLKQMRVVSICAKPIALRELAAFLVEAAAELESGPKHSSWHRHHGPELKQLLGCDVVVCNVE